MMGNTDYFQQFRYCLAIGLSLLLAGCGTTTTPPAYSKAEEATEKRRQVEFKAANSLDLYRRISETGGRLKLANAELCGTFIEPHYGFELWSLPALGQLTALEREVYTEEYGLGDNVQIAVLIPGSALERAGLQIGDKILEINDTKVAAADYMLQSMLTNLKENDDYEPVDIMVRRGKQIFNVTVTPLPACRSVIALDPNSEQVNALADGNRVVVTKGMMNFIQNDEELAFVIAHEISHNAMQHISATQVNSMIGGFLGLALDVAAAAGGVFTGGVMSDLGSRAGAQYNSVEFEAEADYIGMYMLHNAGYDIRGKTEFWRRMAADGSAEIYSSETHPTTPQRFLTMQKTIEEIEGKIARNEPVTPTRDE